MDVEADAKVVVVVEVMDVASDPSMKPQSNPFSLLPANVMLTTVARSWSAGETFLTIRGQVLWELLLFLSTIN